MLSVAHVVVTHGRGWGIHQSFTLTLALSGMCEICLLVMITSKRFTFMSFGGDIKPSVPVNPLKLPACNDYKFYIQLAFLLVIVGSHSHTIWCGTE